MTGAPAFVSCGGPENHRLVLISSFLAKLIGSASNDVRRVNFSMLAEQSGLSGFINSMGVHVTPRFSCETAIGSAPAVITAFVALVALVIAGLLDNSISAWFVARTSNG